MIGLLVITHAKLGAELLGAAEFILGSIEKAESMSILANLDPDEIEKRLAKTVKRLREPDGLLILTDMFGGTPNNISLPHLEPGRVEVITGVNLPMIIKAAGSRDETELAELADEVLKAGQGAISVAGELLRS